MKCLNKKQAVERVNLVTALNTAAEKVEASVALYNEKLEELQSDVRRAIDAYNETLQKATEFVEQIAADAQSDFDDKSEKWQESETGQQTSDWISQWQDASFDEIEVEYPEEMETPDMPHAELLEGLPEEAGM